MKILGSILLYLLISILPCAAIFILFEGLAFQSFLALYFMCSLFCFIYLDRIVLLMLDSREVIDTDEQKLFQFLKNQSYKNFQKLPKVYLFNGHKDSCFILEARKEWTVVMSRKLLKRMNSEQLESFVKYLYDHKQSVAMNFRTSVMGMVAIHIKLIHSLVTRSIFLLELALIFVIGSYLVYEYFLKIDDSFIHGLIGNMSYGFFGTTISLNHIIALCTTPILIYAAIRILTSDDLVLQKSIMFKILSVFFLITLRPFFIFFEAIAKKDYNITVDQKLCPIIDDVEPEDFNFSDLLLEHSVDVPSSKNLIIKFLESFSILKNSGFIRE